MPTEPKKVPRKKIEPELLRVPEVLALTGIKSAAQLFRLRKAGLFPQPIRIGKRGISWRRGDLTEWIKSQPTIA